MRSDKSARRYVALDFYRFVAAFLVVLFHYSEYAQKSGIFSYVSNFSYAVDFFFILSGYVITLAYGQKVGTFSQYKTFLLRRLARLYPLHILTFSIYLLIAIVVYAGFVHLEPEKLARYDASAIPFQLTLTQAWGVGYSMTFNFPSWSISVEWFLYIIFPVLILVARLGWGVLFAAAVAWIAVGLLAIEYFDLRPWNDWVQYAGLLRAVPTFVLGMALYSVLEMYDAKLGSFLPGLIAFGLAVVFMVLDAGTAPTLVAFVLTIALTAMAERGAARSVLQSRLCTILGDSSYSIYMIHAAVATLVLQFFAIRTLHLAGDRLYWVTLGTALLVIPVSVLVFNYFEHPARVALNNMRVPWRVRAAAQERT